MPRFVRGFSYIRGCLHERYSQCSPTNFPNQTAIFTMKQNVKVSNGSLYAVLEIWYNRITKE